MVQSTNEQHRVLWQLLLAASHLPAVRLLPWILSLQQHARDASAEAELNREKDFDEFSDFLTKAKL